MDQGEVLDAMNADEFQRFVERSGEAMRLTEEAVAQAELALVAARQAAEAAKRTLSDLLDPRCEPRKETGYPMAPWDPAWSPPPATTLYPWTTGDPPQWITTTSGTTEPVYFNHCLHCEGYPARDANGVCPKCGRAA